MSVLLHDLRVAVRALLKTPAFPLAAVGTLAIGIAAAYMSGRIVSSWHYEVRASDPLILGAAALVVIAIALIATTVPANRAAHLDPSRTLRPE